MSLKESQSGSLLDPALPPGPEEAVTRGQQGGFLSENGLSTRSRLEGRQGNNGTPLCFLLSQTEMSQPGLTPYPWNKAYLTARTIQY